MKWKMVPVEPTEAMIEAGTAEVFKATAPGQIADEATDKAGAIAMKRSPWFNALKQPPVNGGPDAMYEWRCPAYRGQGRKTKLYLNGNRTCPQCEWRGVLREHDVPGGVVTGGGM